MYDRYIASITEYNLPAVQGILANRASTSGLFKYPFSL